MTSTSEEKSVNGSAKDAEMTTQRIAAAAHDAIDSAAQSAEKVEQQVRQKAADASETIDKTQQAATQQVRESITSLESLVRARPVAAAGMAFAVGALATTLLRRGS